MHVSVIDFVHVAPARSFKKESRKIGIDTQKPNSRIPPKKQRK